ncbi:MAG: Gx transporter family protein [Treponema sp.]|nr:Gx transporter family protein [Treponema sp.]
MTPQAGKAVLPILAAFCLFLSAIEYLIPKPLPFMRIGLSNLPLLLALNIFPAGSWFLLVMLRIFGQALISGSLFSYVFIFSLSGGLASAILMFSLRRLCGSALLSLAGISLAGSLASNAVQLGLAFFFIFGDGVRYLAPPFLSAGLVSGLALGLFAEAFTRKSRWYRLLQAGEPFPPVPETAISETKQRGPDRIFSPVFLFIAGLVLMLIFLFTRSLKWQIIQFAVYTFLALLSGKKLKPLFTLLVMAGIVAGNLLAPFGKILYSLGPFRITEGALFSGLRRALTLEGLFMLSAAFIRPGLRFPGFFGSLLARTFGIFSLMQEKKTHFKKGHIVEEIDNLLLDLSQPER